MRLITPVVFLGLICLAPLSATPVCGNNGYTGNGLCSSVSFAGPFGVFVSASGPSGSIFYAGASSETDAILTVTGGTGPGFVNFFYSFDLQADTQDNGSLVGKINGRQSFYFDSSRIIIYNGAGISIVYGEPQLIHLEFSASVSSNARPNSWDTLSGSLSLGPYSIRGDVPGTQYTLTEVPEPGYSVLIAVILALAAAVTTTLPVHPPLPSKRQRIA